MRILIRRNLVYVVAAISFAGVGYGVATFQAKRAEARDRAMVATAELWYTYELLQSRQISTYRR